MPNRFTRTKADAEHQRLQSAVVEAALAWYKGDEQRPDRTKLKAAIKAFIAFESEHGIGEK